MPLNDSSVLTQSVTKASWGLFLLLSGFFLLTAGGHIYVRDGGAMFFMSDSILDRGWFDVPQNPNTGGGRIGPDGRYYMPFGVLQPLLAVPFLWIGRQLIGWSQASYIPSMTIIWFNAFATAGLFTFLFRFWIDLQTPIRKATVFSILASISTPFWIYSRTFFAEPIASWGLLASAWALHNYSKKDQLLPIVWAAVWAVAVLLVRPISGTAFPILLLYLLLIENQRSKPGSSIARLRPVMLFALILCIGVVLGLLYNYIRFGDFFETGYNYLPDGRLRTFTRDPISGLQILLFSPGKSIFIFAPLSIAALAGTLLFKQNERPVQILTLTMPLIFLTVLCRWGEVEGGVTWGPRLFLPALPIFFLGIAPLLRFKNRTIPALLLLLCLAGLCIQLLGITVNFSTYIANNINSYFNPQTGYYQENFNPFPGHIKAMIENVKAIPDLQPLIPEIAQRNRSLIQINYAEDLDFWFIHLYRDGVPASFIFSLSILFSFILITGAFFIITALTRKH